MKAKITVNREKVQGEVSPLLFGHFMEHAFGNIYGGVYDPGPVSYTHLFSKRGYTKDRTAARLKAAPKGRRSPPGFRTQQIKWGK